MVDNKTVISKGAYVSLVWVILLVGLLIQGFLYYFLIKQLPFDYWSTLGLFGFCLLLTGWSLGLATARQFRIIGVDD